MATSSTLARVGQVTTLCVVAAVGVWAIAWWPRSPWLAVAGAAAIAFSHAWVLAVEFVLLHRVARGDATVPCAAGLRLLRAWWSETLQGFVVFAWRQPWRWRAVPDHLSAASGYGGLAGRHGVVFVHGFVCNRGFWTPWLARARADGRAFVAVNLEPMFTGIDDYAPILQAAVERVRQATGLPPVLVCHSMGGLVARAWLRAGSKSGREGGGHPPESVAHVVTIGSPHAGTWLARFSHLTNGRQMRQGSEWLKELQKSWSPAMGARFTCWYADCDNIVMPPSTATLPGADNRLVQGAAHVDLAFRAEVVRGTLDLINQLDRRAAPACTAPARRTA